MWQKLVNKEETQENQEWRGEWKTGSCSDVTTCPHSHPRVWDSEAAWAEAAAGVGWGGGKYPVQTYLRSGEWESCPVSKWRLSKGHGIKSGQDEWWRRYSETSWSLVRLPGTAGHPFCPFDGFLVGFPVFSLGKLVYLLNALQGSFCFLL